MMEQTAYQQRRQKKLSIICPVLNEEEVIPLFIKELVPYLQTAIKPLGNGADYEIIFVDDGSTDNTYPIIYGLSLNDPRIKCVSFSRNFGKEAALSAGMKNATGDAVIPIDVDLQDPPELVIKMVEEWVKGADVVNAMRVDRTSDSWIKRSTASWFYDVYNKMSDRPIPTNVGDYRLLDRKVVDAVCKLNEHNRFMKALFSWVGFKQVSLEYVRQERVAGTSKFRYWKLWNFALDGITASTTTPLRAWTYIGLALFVSTLLYALYIVVQTIIHGIDVPGYASLMVVILLMGSFNFLSLGILGEYVGRIAEEVRDRPLYIVRDKIGLN